MKSRADRSKSLRELRFANASISRGLRLVLDFAGFLHDAILADDLSPNSLFAQPSWFPAARRCSAMSAKEASGNRGKV
ncbi:MAG TPA: hypothetical protein VMV13_08335, partial [Candidatus Binataceae bacterium]|nr:hypothetical protein [Candidatus Binataceae bacterium]